MGPVGAGKTTAIHTLSDIEVVHTEARATDATRHLKATTTVSMDVGVLHLPGNDKLRLYGAPGQDRFDFMWDILLEQAKAAIVLTDTTAEHQQIQTAQRANQRAQLTLQTVGQQVDGMPRGRLGTGAQGTHVAGQPGYPQPATFPVEQLLQGVGIHAPFAHQVEQYARVELAAATAHR